MEVERFEVEEDNGTLAEGARKPQFEPAEGSPIEEGLEPRVVNPSERASKNGEGPADAGTPMRKSFVIQDDDDSDSVMHH